MSGKKGRMKKKAPLFLSKKAQQKQVSQKGRRRVAAAKGFK